MKITVKVDKGYITVKGSPGYEHCRVLLSDVDGVTVQALGLGSAPLGQRFTELHLIGNGVILGRAQVKTMMLASPAVTEAGDWLRRELPLLRAA